MLIDIIVFLLSYFCQEANKHSLVDSNELPVAQLPLMLKLDAHPSAFEIRFEISKKIYIILF